jgi:signal transduction histidine kinase
VSARSAEPGTVVVEVRDRGPGLTPANVERAVERFFRSGDRDAEGFGLGLSIAREVAHALGGRLELESSPGAGTTARIVLRSAPATGGHDRGRDERQEVEVG